MPKMSTPNTSLDGYRTAHLYTVGEAARFAGVSTRTVNRWLYGDDYSPPVLQYETEAGHRHPRATVSFLQVLELKIAQSFRRSSRVELFRVRRAHEYLKNKFGLEFPFASVPLTTLGGRILEDFEREEPGTHLIEVGGTQAALPGIVTTTLYTYDFAEDDIANRWHPVGRSIPIVIDPYVSAGMPTVEDRRVTVQAIHKRHKAGQSPEFMSRDLDIELPKLEVILLYAKEVRIAA